MRDTNSRLSTREYLRLIGVPELPPLTSPFEAPNKPSQFAFLEHFGPGVHLCNVRLEELLRVEIFRRGLHSDAFALSNLRPARPNHVTV